MINNISNIIENLTKLNTTLAEQNKIISNLKNTINNQNEIISDLKYKRVMDSKFIGALKKDLKSTKQENLKLSTDKKCLHDMYCEAMENYKNLQSEYKTNKSSSIHFVPTDANFIIRPQLISKKDFVLIINECEKYSNYLTTLSKYIGDDVIRNFMNLIDDIIDYVDKNISADMYQKQDWLVYFVYELNYLTEYQPDTIKIEDKAVDVSSWDKVYDFIIDECERMRETNNTTTPKTTL